MARQLDGPLGLVVHPKRDVDRALAGIREWADREGLQVGQVAVGGNDRRGAGPNAGGDRAGVGGGGGGGGPAPGALPRGGGPQTPPPGPGGGARGPPPGPPPRGGGA